MEQFIVLILVRDSVTRFSTLFLYTKKTSPGPHMNRQKRFFKTFSFHVDICEKQLSAQSTTTPTHCQCGQQLRGHCVSVVKDYVDTVSAQSTTMRTCVSIVNDYADIVSKQSMTTLTHRKLFYFGKSKNKRKK